jgi:hypothetical protein
VVSIKRRFHISKPVIYFEFPNLRSNQINKFHERILLSSG